MENGRRPVIVSDVLVDAHQFNSEDWHHLMRAFGDAMRIEHFLIEFIVASIPHQLSGADALLDSERELHNHGRIGEDFIKSMMVFYLVDNILV
jgi:hypothetical protein